MSLFKDKIIGVLLGGLSKEREISLKSGNAVLEALLQKGYDAVAVDVGRDVVSQLKALGVEIAFLALHGRYGEDGCIQGLLEILNIPYTGSSVLASSLAMDKFLTKEIARGLKIPMAEDAFFDSIQESAESFAARLALSFPVMIKPSREGSTLGIEKITRPADLLPALQRAAAIDSRVLVEKFIQGREVTVGILDKKPLPIVEVIPKNGFYDFASKYTPGATEYFCPADLPAALTEKLQKMSVELFRHLGCEGVARSDFMIDAAGESYFLEINTLPGMTATSLVPKAAKAAGISFPDLVERILSTARVKVQ